MPNAYLILRPNFIARPSTCHGQHSFTDGFIKGAGRKVLQLRFCFSEKQYRFLSTSITVLLVRWKVEDGEWIVFLNSDAFAKMD